MKDLAPNAYEQMIDRYLASPHFGEQRARYWLDVARYDADGLHAEFGKRFELLRHLEEVHQTPLGRAQQAAETAAVITFLCSGAASYVFDEETRAFMEQSNPWALRGITERLMEAASRGLWEAPDPKTLDQLRQTYLDLEGDLESRGD